MHSEVHERLRAISRARAFAIWSGVGMFALMAWTAFGWSLLELCVAVCLWLPPAALALADRWSTLLTLWGRRNTDLRVSLSVALIAGVAVPSVVPFRILNVANLPVLVLPALAIGALATARALRTDPALRQRTSDAAMVAVCLVLYGGALAFWLNHALPPLEERRAVVTVTDLRQQREHKGQITFLARATSATTLEDGDDYRVPHDVWKRLQVGAPACIDERRGLLGVTETAISPCAAGATPS